MFNWESVLHFVSCILAASTLFSLGVFALYKNYKKPANVYFALASFAVAFWNINDIFVYIISDHYLALRVFRTSYIGCVFFIPWFLRTTLELSQRKISESKFLKFIFNISYIYAGLIAILAVFTPLILKDIVKVPFHEVRGTLYFLVTPFFMGGFLLSVYYLYVGYKKAQDLKKLQLKYFLIANGIAFIAAGIFFSFGTIIKFDIAPIYYLLEVGYGLVVAYAVVQYKFFDASKFLKIGLIFLPCFSIPFLFLLPLNLRITSALCAAIFSFSLGLFAQLKGRKEHVNRYFAFFSFCAGIWNMDELVILLPKSYVSLFLYRLSYIGGSFIVASYLNFMFVLLGYWEKAKTKIKIINILAIVFSVFSLTPLIIRNIEYDYPQLTPLKEIPGLLYIPFGIFFISVLMYSVYPFIPAFKNSTGIKRNQIKYAILATSLGIVAVSFFFGSMATEKIPPLHYIVQIAMFASFAIGIIRYKLLDFNIAMRNTVVNVATALVFSLPFILLFFAFKGLAAYIFLLILALSFYPLFFRKVVPQFTAFLNRKLFPQFSYYELLPQIKKELDETYTTGQVAWKIVKPVAEAMKLIGASCLVYDREEDAYLPKAAVGVNEVMIKGSPEFVTLGLENPLIVYLKTKGQPIIDEELAGGALTDKFTFNIGSPLIISRASSATTSISQSEEKIPPDPPFSKGGISGEREIPLSPPLLKGDKRGIYYSTVEEKELEVSVREEMENLESKICMPLFVGKRLVAILGLNRKESGNMFNQEDLAALQELCHEAEKRLSQILFTEYRLRFLGGLAHDIRAPYVKSGRLMDILDKALMGEYGEIDGELKKALGSAYDDCLEQRRKVELQANISKQLKRFLDAEEPVMEFDLKAALSKVVEKHFLEAKLKNLYLEMKCPESLPLVRANEEDIERIANNLIGNALKFTQSGGITVRVEKNSDELILAVEDTGPGISDGDKKQILKYGGQGNTAEKKLGLGLGLAIVKELAESNGARFWYESTWGKGSVFYIGIPLKNDRWPTTGEPAANEE